jgi:4-alpha-glucanotransferase
MFEHRTSGILLHITSLPSRFGIGDLGPEAYRFADFLAQAKQHFWQILPLSPIDSVFNISPYHCTSAFAYNTLLISPELMASDGLLQKKDLDVLVCLSNKGVDYEAVLFSREKLFKKAFTRFHIIDQKEYQKFCEENGFWIEDFAIFMALKKHFHGKRWADWPEKLKNRHKEALLSARKDLHENIEYEKFLQFVFHQQWHKLRSCCKTKGIRIIGDIPIYVDYDSVDCWTHSEIFKLDKNKKPYKVSGVPPDYFSKTGQRWGNPVYRWDILKEREYDWWVQRLGHCLKLHDVVRIDHFRGFVAYWEIPAREKTAVKGKWVKAPAMSFFRQLLQKFPTPPIIVEDLGFVTPDVTEVVEYFGFPGMKVLLFAFGKDDPDHPYLPHTYPKNCVVYTGTHDNNTVRGWFMREARPDDKKRLFRYIGRKVSEKNIHQEFIKLAMMSEANVSIIPIQDVLGLGQEARMNHPATRRGNWTWRLKPEQLTADVAEEMAEFTKASNRANIGPPTQVCSD